MTAAFPVSTSVHGGPPNAFSESGGSRYRRGVLSEIPANIPPWLRSLYEPEQLMQLSGDADAATATEAEQFIDDPRNVVWVWKDWQRAELQSTLNEAGERADAAFALLDEGSHCEFLWGGASGYPSVVFPTGDPTRFVEAQPFEARELVGRLHEYNGQHHISREQPIAEFRLQTEPD